MTLGTAVKTLRHFRPGQRVLTLHQLATETEIPARYLAELEDDTRTTLPPGPRWRFSARSVTLLETGLWPSSRPPS